MAEWMFLFPCAKLNLPCSPGSGGRALRAVSELDVQRLRRQGHLLCFLTRRGILQWLICQLRELFKQLGRARVKKVEREIPKKMAARMPQCQGRAPESFCLLGQEEAQSASF